MRVQGSHVFEAEGERLDQALARALGVSRARAQAWISAGHVRVAGEVVTKPARRLAGERVEVEVPPEPPARVEAEDLTVEILYEDEDMVVVNKPAGMVTHPAPGVTRGTLVNALLGRWVEPGGEPVRPGIVHRLDKETSGVIVVARHEAALRRLADAFKQRFVFKRYVALTEGVPANTTVIAPIGRHPVHRFKMHTGGIKARYAETDFEVVATAEGRALVEARPHTGRTHQIRVHLKHLHTPIWADPLYGKPSPFIGRLALHAYELRVPHPKSGKILSFTAPVPEDMARGWEAAGGVWPEGVQRAGTSR
nr:RluA family pseudouridine synthase [Oceanithermus profundus]